MNARLLFLAIPVVSLSMFGQGVPPAADTACGPAGVKLKVKTSDASQPALPAADPSKATIVFVEDQLQERPGHAPCPKCSTRVQLAMDSNWFAATNGFSHTAFSVEPGEHHFCASGGDHFYVDSPLPSLMPLHVEAGKTYYLRARVSFFYGYNVQVLDLSQINEDEGKYLVSMSKTATIVP